MTSINSNIFNQFNKNLNSMYLNEETGKIEQHSSNIDIDEKINKYRLINNAIYQRATYIDKLLSASYFVIGISLSYYLLKKDDKIAYFLAGMINISMIYQLIVPRDKKYYQYVCGIRL